MWDADADADSDSDLDSDTDCSACAMGKRLDGEKLTGKWKLVTMDLTN